MNLRIEETRDIVLCRQLRRIVFIQEQDVPEADEVDDKDDDAIHMLARIDDHPVGSARLLRYGAEGKIGRVCVLKSSRGLGIGAALIRRSVDRFRQMPEIAAVRLGAQTHALGFYAALGFVAEGPEYLDSGILHRDMVLVLNTAQS